MPVSKTSQFRGDAEGLLDRLVEACQRPEASGEIRERALQPVCNAWLEGCNPIAGEAPSPSAASGAAAVAVRPRSNLSSQPSNKRQSHPSPGNSPGATPPRARKHQGAASCPQAPVHAFACPAIFSSPKPESLPAPSSLLLLCACEAAA